VSTELETLETELNNLERQLNQRQGAKEMLEKKSTELREQVSALDVSIVDTEKAIWILQQYAESQQNYLTERIEGIVTKGLRAVFQDPTLEFKLKYSETKTGEKKKNPEVAMSVRYESGGEMVEGNLKNTFGGGLSVVAATLLRVVVVLHLKDRVAPIILLDEPLKDLSPAYDGGDDIANGYRERMSEFIQSLVSETDLQIIMVSHEPEYGRIADTHHRFTGAVGEQTTVRTIENITAEVEDYGMDEFI
jgi:hypothetical protein